MISLLYATDRPQVIDETLRTWETSAFTHPDFEFIIVTDYKVEWQKKYSPYQVKHFINKSRNDCVTAYNLAAKYCCGDILIQISDDFFPIEAGWNWTIWNLMDINKKQALAVSDNSVNTDGFKVMRHSIITRKFYEFMGYLLYPEYKSMYSDDDASAMAHKYAEVIDGRNKIKFIHNHIGPHKDKVASKHESNERYWEGNRLFLSRLRQGFPI